MKNHHATLLVLAGGWLSLTALTIGGSILLPPERSASDASAALLYRYAASDVSVSARQEKDIGRAIIADLDTMQLSLYEEGVLVKSFPILSKGRPGTAWETPTGNYVIQARELKHFSSIGGTWMPYSMQFYGNYFIHGWPTYADGSEVPIGYSGGCIRLGTDDAQEVYEFVPKGARVSVVGSGSASVATTTAEYFLHGDGSIPDVSARAFVVEDAHSGHVLWEVASEEAVRTRGLSKMATALTALEVVNQYKLVRMSELLLGKSILRKYSIGAIDEMPAGVLIYPLLFDTNDTAASVFASEHGSKQFVKYMNEKTRAIGMHNTVFAGPRSTDTSTTTARDLATLLTYVKKNKNFLINVTLTKEKTLFDSDGDERFTWQNRNPWIVSNDAAFRGGIIDMDDRGAGSAMLLFDIAVSEFSSRTIAFVVIDSAHLEEDVMKLRRFVSENFIYGVGEKGTMFIKEAGEPIPGLLEKAKQLLEFEGWLRGTSKSGQRT